MAMVWKPPLRPGLPVGIALLALPLVLLLVAVAALIWRTLDPITIALGVLAVPLLAAVIVMGRALAGLLSLRYVVDDSGLTIEHQGERLHLDRDSILEIAKAPPLGPVRVPGLSWSGYRVGIGRVPRMGRARFFITNERPGAALVVRTRTGLFVISPDHPDEFLAHWGVGPDTSTAPAGAHPSHRGQPPAEGVGRGSLDARGGYPGGALAARPVARAADFDRAESRPLAERVPVYPLRATSAERAVALDAREVADADAAHLAETAVLPGLVPRARNSLATPVEVASPSRREVLVAAGERDEVLPSAAGVLEPAPAATGVAAPAAAEALGLRVLAAALVLNLALYAFVAVRYPVLADAGALPIHRNSLGLVDRLVDPVWAFYFPLMGSLFLLTSAGVAWLMRRENPLAAAIAVGAAPFVQLVVIVAGLFVLI